MEKGSSCSKITTALHIGPKQKALNTVKSIEGFLFGLVFYLQCSGSIRYFLCVSSMGFSQKNPGCIFCRNGVSNI